MASKLIKRIWGTPFAEQEREEAEFVKQIEHGLANGEFKMYLQFIVDNKEKKIVSAEALSRWQDANGEIISPVKYIAVMERNGLIAKLDYFMFEKACQKLVAWQNTEFDHITLSCNFTRITISEKNFAATLASIADKYAFDRSKLSIEITEDAVEKNPEVARGNIFKAKELGFKIALDDVGSGFTSFINLCEYPLDAVKIDRDILLRTDNLRGKKLFWGMISLAHFLNLAVVCEGVETEEQNKFVSESECDYIQGWYYAKPMPEEKAEDFATAYAEKA